MLYKILYNKHYEPIQKGIYADYRKAILHIRTFKNYSACVSFKQYNIQCACVPFNTVNNACVSSFMFH